MILKTRFAIALFSFALLASSGAQAADPLVGLLLGGAVGSAVGRDVGGRHGAVVGGMLGAAAGVAVTNDMNRQSSGYSGYHYAPVDAYPVPVARRYYPQPVVVAAPVYVERGYRRGGGYYYHDRPSRGWDHRGGSRHHY